MKPLFARRSQLGLRLVLFAILSIVLMVLDHRQNYLGAVRVALSSLVAPIQYMVNAPLKLINEVNVNLTSRQALLAQNSALQAQQLLLQAKLQKLMALENENSQLRALLASSPRIHSERIAIAELLAVATDPQMSEIVLNKGRTDSAYVGQPVLDANGIMGQVIEVGAFTSRVLLLSDPRSAIPVQDARNGVRGIIVGKGHLSALALTNISATVDVQVGDLLVSSGLGGHYPEGYPVGVVQQIRHDPSEQFASIVVTPSAQLDRNQPVLLIWTPKTVIDVAPSTNVQDKSHPAHAKKTQKKS